MSCLSPLHYRPSVHYPGVHAVQSSELDLPEQLSALSLSPSFANFSYLFHFQPRLTPDGVADKDGVQPRGTCVCRLFVKQIGQSTATGARLYK